MGGPIQLRLPVVVLVAAFSSGCVLRIYQPLSDVGQPVLVRTDAPNFTGLTIRLSCPTGGMLNRMEAADLCRHTQLLLERQGAQVIRAASERRFGDPPPSEASGPPDLSLRLTAREIHQARHPWSWVLCAASFTAIPAMVETTFAQEVHIRDASGFVLLEDTIQGRIVERYSPLARLTNWMLDKLWRPPAEALTGSAFEERLTADLDGRLSQLVFDATMRAQVLGSFRVSDHRVASPAKEASPTAESAEDGP